MHNLHFFLFIEMNLFYRQHHKNRIYFATYSNIFSATTISDCEQTTKTMKSCSADVIMNVRTRINRTFYYISKLKSISRFICIFFPIYFSSLIFHILPFFFFFPSAWGRWTDFKRCNVGQRADGTHRVSPRTSCQLLEWSREKKDFNFSKQQR